MTPLADEPEFRCGAEEGRLGMMSPKTFVRYVLRSLCAAALAGCGTGNSSGVANQDAGDGPSVVALPDSSGGTGEVDIDAGDGPSVVALPDSSGGTGEVDIDAGDGPSCQTQYPPFYSSPGCGVDAIPRWPRCDGTATDVPAIGIYYCGCGGRTILGGVSGVDQPYRFQGCCPGDTGFGPLGSYSCPADGGLPYSGRPPVDADPRIIEFEIPTANSGPWGIALGADGNLWFTERDGNRIGRITPAGVITEFPVPSTNPRPFDITPGPDGNLWFTEDRVYSNLGRITISGIITEFALPNTSAWPRSIAAGPDGNLWFTQSSGPTIGIGTTSGSITELAVSTVASALNDITVGPDGDLWFTDSIGDKIGHILASGAIVAFPVPIPAGSNGSPERIIAGPDGALWFTKNAASLGRITTAGTLTDFPIPSTADSIATGPDGALWFTENHVNRIGRITTSGSVSEVGVSSPGGPLDIAVGSDGNIWFTEYGGNKIGRLAP